MRALAVALLLAGCGPSIPEARDPQTPPEMTPQHEVLVQRLKDPAIEVLLYRVIGLHGSVQRWVYDEKTKIERPGPDVPHKTLSMEDRERLAGLATGAQLQVGDDDFAGHSYLVEFLKDGVPIGRADAHTERGPATLFFICKNEGRIPTGTVQFTFTSAGRRSWLQAFDEIWQPRAK